MDLDPGKSEVAWRSNLGSLQPQLPFHGELLEKVLSFIDSHKDRNSVSLMSRDWYNAERWTRSKLFIGNCYSVSPEFVARRFPRIKSVTLKGKPRFADFNMLPRDWGADVHSWLLVFAKAYPFLEELRLKRMTVTDDSLELLVKSFPGFKALTMNLTELDIQECITAQIQDRCSTDIGGAWLKCFPEDLTSLEVLNFASLDSVVRFEDLEKLVSRCKSLRVLKVNESITMLQLQQLLMHAPQLVELRAGNFHRELTDHQFVDIESTFNQCKCLQVLSGLWGTTSDDLRVLYRACAGLTFLNLSEATLQSGTFARLLTHCPNLRSLWVSDNVEDHGLAAVGSYCPVLEELRVFPNDPFDQDPDDGVTELGFLAVSSGCPKLRYVLYFCRRMTNAAVATIVRNCPHFTHFRLFIMTPGLPDHLTNEPVDEAFGAVVKTCSKLRRLSVSGHLTDAAFQNIGTYAKNIETLSVAFAGGSDQGMQFVLEGCPKLRKLDIRDCPFGDTALLSVQGKYERMLSLWMSGCNVTVKGCKLLAREMPRLNVEVITKEGNGNELAANKVYVYLSMAGQRRDAPPSVLTL